ncbi:MAG: endolytic transglycosylase MltG [Bacteroidota bacterium]|nr:endolytic transglycosylase MltG [Bacteroidota bacterium]
MTTKKKTKKNTVKNHKSSSIKKFFIFLLIITLIACSFAGYMFYFFNNVNTGSKKSAYLYIHTGSNFNNLLDSINSKKILKETVSFKLFAKFKRYDKHIKPGRYLLKKGMSNNQIVNLLRSGKQDPVKVVLHNIRLKEELASKVAKYLEADSVKILDMLNNKDYLSKYNLNPDNVLSMIIPNTYIMNWNTSAEKFLDRMTKEYKMFWTKDRIKKADALNLTPVEVSILASIVQSESLKEDEMTTIAGVYINRLRKGILLQADPTVVYAIGDFSINRVLKKQLSVDSPYNTYKYKGLPPGPITLPYPTTIDKVLDYKGHEYLYFCAKEDFSGHHNFAKTEAEHNKNAKKFQHALDARNIKR